MNLSKHIEFLLNNYDCVIIPNFGGFIANKHDAIIDHNTNTLYPPSKSISFNSFLKHNDGLLANTISSVVDITYEQANKAIANVVKDWEKKLQTQHLILDNIGTLTLTDEQKISFIPNSKTNFLLDSYGFSSVKIPVLNFTKEEDFTETDIDQDQSFIDNGTHEKTSKVRKIHPLVKYAASVAIGLTLITTLYNNQQNAANQEKLVYQQKVTQQKIQEATFLIKDPLPEVTFNISKPETPDTFFIIVGAFQNKINAERKVSQLKALGYSSQIIGQNKWGLIQVSLSSHNSLEDAKASLKVARELSSDAWLLIK